MKRLVYTPTVNVFVKTDYGIIDVSPFITAGGVQRKLDQVSSAQITLRNPNKKWTNHSYLDSITGHQTIGPVFHPMDPIVIFMTRLRNAPIQVFTGYLDTTPYLQLFPATVTLQASCTLKRLQYTYFDPGLPFFEEFLTQHGWQVAQGKGIVNPNAEDGTAFQKGQLKDSGFGQLLFSVLEEVGGWDDSTIYIEKLPTGLIELVAKLFNQSSTEAKESNQEMIDLLHRIIGTASLGTGNPGPITSGSGSGDWIRVGATLDPTSGQAPTFSDHNGMSFAELLIAGTNANLKSEALYRVLGIAQKDSYPYGMPMETPIEIRMPGASRSFKIWKNDVGSGQTGDAHFKIDLHQGIANVLGWSPNQDVEVRKI